METQTTPVATPMVVATPTPIWKSALALITSLLVLALFIYVISRAWKKGQVAAA
jgi:hypothetical protein